MRIRCQWRFLKKENERERERERSIHGLYEETLVKFNVTLQTIRNLYLIPLTKIVGNNRQSRALLPFVGSLSKSIFGTANMDDVNIL